MRKNIIKNERFGRWVVIKKSKTPTYLKVCTKRHYWLCKCVCGETKIVAAHALLSGKSKSCGCIRKEILSKLLSTHRKCNSSEYSIWHGIKTRCLNKNSISYHNYGGRGIKICKRWINSFENFYRDMGKKPSRLHSIDRIDNDGDYKPSNCTWSNKTEQSNNRRNTKIITYKNKSMSFAQWARALGLKRHCLYSRIKRGWTINRTLSTPIVKR